MYKIIKSNEGTIHKIADNKIATNLITKEISLGVSLAVIDAKEYQEKETTLYNRIYYVVDGKLTLTFENDTHDLESGDSCFISKGTVYDMSGTFKTIVINQPAFGV